MANDSSTHLDSAMLIQLEEGRFADDVRTRALSHLETCGRCQAELALVRSYRAVPEGERLGKGRSERLEAAFRKKLQERTKVEGVTFPRQRPLSRMRLGPVHLVRSGRNWMVGGLLAASLALLFVGGYQMLQGSEPGELGMGFRSAGDDARDFRAQVESTPTAWELSWPSQNGLDVYHVRVLTARGRVLFEQEVAATELRIERSQLTGAELADLLFVQVEAMHAVGHVLRSAPIRLLAEDRP